MADQNQNPNQQGQKAGAEQQKIKVEVRSKGDAGFRRMGQHFTSSPTEIEVTEEEYEQQLKNEGQLIVRRLDGKQDQQGGLTGQAAGATGGGSGNAPGQPGQGKYDTSGQLGAPVG